MKHRVFKNVTMTSLPVYYREQKWAWVGAFLFKKWFKYEFGPGNLESEEDENCSLLQAYHYQWIISFNRCSRHKLLSENLCKLKKLLTALKCINIKEAYKKMHQSTFENSNQMLKRLIEIIRKLTDLIKLPDCKFNELQNLIELVHIYTKILSKLNFIFT